jgi:hypothetical protein
MPLWKNDDQLFAIARSELFSSVLGDLEQSAQPARTPL